MDRCPNSGNVRYGWRIRGGKLEQDPEQQEVIAMILAFREDGMAYETIAQELNISGVTPVRSDSSRWHGTTVKDIVCRADEPYGG